MHDAFAHRVRTPSDPAITIFPIVPDDSTDLPKVTTALNVETPGKVRVTTADGSVGDITLVPGQAVAIRACRVWLTGTTATGISGLA